MSPGESILGYTIVECLSEGAFCKSYRADRGGSAFFLKVYFPFENARETSRFKNNQDQIANLLKDYPYCEKVIETTKLPSGQIVQAKEFINGKDLSVVLEGVSSAKALLEYAIQMSRNVLELHNRRIVHSDLKPQQFMVNSVDNCVYVIDLDWSFPEGKRLKTVGTVLYKSPEHYEKKEITLKSDVFTTGIILYEMLTRGGHPFLEEGVICDDDVIWRAMRSRKPVRPLHEAVSFWTKELSVVLNRMLAIEPHLRPDMKEVVKALEEEKERLFTEVPVSVVLQVEGTHAYCYIDQDIDFDRGKAKEFFEGLRDEEGDPLYYYWNKDGTPLFRISKERGKGWFIEDGLGSHNWIEINGTKLCGKTRLKNSDRLTLTYRKTGKGVANFLVNL